eukprot:10106314-Alexandrium_andersonii.AAC.1
MARGFRNRTVEQVLEPLLSFMEAVHGSGRSMMEEDEEDQVMYTAVSWDYSSAFDRVSPDTCRSLWTSFGIPELIANSFHDVWKG